MRDEHTVFKARAVDEVSTHWNTH